MNAQCIMVCSGKGGTGKSTVSVLLGACLARLGRKTLLVELDSGLRSVDIIAGVYGRTVYDIEDVLCGRCEGAKAVVPSPLYPGLSVISAPYEGGAVEAAPLGRLLTAMRPYFDFILLDTAAGMGARASKGTETLYKHAIEGFTGPYGGVMPPRGGNPGLTDEQIHATVDWMLANVK